MTSQSAFALLVFIVLAVLVGIPFILLCRLLWHAGSWFKRKDR